MDDKYWVTMTDKFMTGWGLSADRINKYVIECDTLARAEYLEDKAHNRHEMKYVNIRQTKPYYNQQKYYTDYIHESDIDW